jgi:hypothetical protein
MGQCTLISLLYSAKEQIGCQRNHGFHRVVIHQILADFLFSTAPVKNTREADNGGAAFAGQITQCVQHKGKVGFGFGCEHTGGGKTFIIRHYIEFQVAIF